MREFHFFKQVLLVVFISVFLVMSTALVRQVLGCTATRNRFRTWSDCDNNVNPIYDFTGGGFNQVCLGKPFQNYYYATIIFEPDRTCEQKTGDVAWLVGEWSNENLAEGDTCKVRWNIDCSGCFEGFWDPDGVPGCVGCEGCGRVCDRSEDCPPSEEYPLGYGPKEVWKDFCGESGQGNGLCEQACGAHRDCDEKDEGGIAREDTNWVCDGPCKRVKRTWVCDENCQPVEVDPEVDDAPKKHRCKMVNGEAIFVPDEPCDQRLRCSSDREDGYGDGGNRYGCRGYCDGDGNCDYPDDCHDCYAANEQEWLDKFSPCEGYVYSPSKYQWRDWECEDGYCACTVRHDVILFPGVGKCIDIVVDERDTIDIRDIATVAKAFGSAAVDNPDTELDETERWNPAADIDDDGEIDIRDIARVARWFGAGTDGCMPYE